MKVSATVEVNTKMDYTEAQVRKALIRALRVNMPEIQEYVEDALEGISRGVTIKIRD